MDTEKAKRGKLVVCGKDFESIDFKGCVFLWMWLLDGLEEKRGPGGGRNMEWISNKTNLNGKKGGIAEHRSEKWLKKRRDVGASY